MIWLLSFSLVLCLVLSSFFSGSEIAYSCANTIRLENQAEDGDKASERALRITRNYDSALSTILIGNNLVNIAASSIGSVIIYTIFGNDAYAWVSTAVVTILVIIFGETIPKISAKRNATSMARSASGFLRFLMIILKPVVFIVVLLVNAISGLFKGQTEEEEDADELVEELESIIDTAESEGVIDEDDSLLIHNAIDFSEIMASEVMTARVDMVALDIDDRWEDILSLISKCQYSRLPVYQDSIDNIIGVVHLNAFFKEVAEHDGKAFDIRSILMTPCYVYKTMKLPSVLRQLREAKQHLAIVTDEYSGTLGVVTMEDVLEQIVGEIWDENDTVEDEVVQRNENEFELDGDLVISEFLELVGIEEDEFEAQSETAGGWVIEMLDHFPSVGESFEYENLTVTVLEMDRRRVASILVKKKPTEE